MAYASQTLRSAERNAKSSLKLELLRAKRSIIEKFCHYVLDAEVEIYTDNRGFTFWKKATLGAIDQ